MADRLPEQAENSSRVVTVKNLLSDNLAETRQRILDLYRAYKTSDEIAITMNGELSGSTRHISAVASLVRKLIARFLPEDERREHEREMHRRRAMRNHASQNAARDEAFRARGMKVWTAEEKEYFKGLLMNDEFNRKEDRQTKKRRKRLRRMHVNHVKLAQAMNEHFQTTEFTPEKTATHLDYLKAQTRQRVKSNTVSKNN